MTPQTRNCVFFCKQRFSLWRNANSFPWYKMLPKLKFKTCDLPQWQLYFSVLFSCMAKAHFSEDALQFLDGFCFIANWLAWRLNCLEDISGTYQDTEESTGNKTVARSCSPYEELSSVACRAQLEVISGTQQCSIKAVVRSYCRKIVAQQEERTCKTR